MATPTPLAFTPIADALGYAYGSAGETFTTAGYLVVDSAGARLVDGLSFSAGSTPVPLAGPGDQIWVGDGAPEEIMQALRSGGEVHYAIVAARGRLDGPGQHGPGGRYRYRLHDARFQPVAPVETTVAALLNQPAYRDRLVRVEGFLLSAGDSVLLFDHMSATGVPGPEANSIKLSGRLRDQALLEQLSLNQSGEVRFGPVQIEGIWHDGLLVPLSIRRLSWE